MTLSKLQLQITLLCLAVVALVMRLYQLDADTPNHFAGLGQALLSDPYHITVHARSKVLFGEWDPFGYGRWVAFKVSLVSGTAYLLFSIFEVSRYVANLGSTMLSLFGSFFVILGILVSPSPSERKKEIILASLIAASLLAVSHPIIVYGRLPFLENGLLFLSGATFLVMMRYGRSVWGAALVGALVALCPLAGKLFGVMIAAPVLLALMLSGAGAGKRIVAATLSGAITAGFWYMFVLGDQTGAYHAYLQEQSLGLYGFPRGLESPANFVEQLITYGAEFRLFKFQPILPLLLLLGVLLALARHGTEMFTLGMTYWRQRPALTFFTVWLVVSWLGLMIFQYRPLRYSLFVLLPLIGAVSCLLSEVFTEANALSARAVKFLYSWKIQIALLLLVWIVITQAQFAFVPGGEMWARFSMIYWSSFGGAVAVLILFNLLKSRMRKFLSGGGLKYAVVATLGLSVSAHGYWHLRMASNFTHDALAASHDLGQLIPGTAVITGPYAPNLTIDNGHKCLIYSFGLARDEQDLFDRYPISHIAMEQGNIHRIKEKFSRLPETIFVNRWLIRDVLINVVQTKRDALSRREGVEKTVDRYMKSRNYDSAYYYASEFTEKFPENRIGKQTFLHVLIATARHDEALEFGRKMIVDDPTDFNTYVGVARACLQANADGRRPALREEGDKYVLRATELNPAAKEYILLMFGRP